MATERARRSQDGEVDERPEREDEAPAAESNVALLMQRMHGNQAVSRMLTRTPRMLARFDHEFTYQGAGIQKETIDDAKSCLEATEAVLEEDLAGHRALFWQNESATSVDAWASLIFGLMGDRYEFDGIGEGDVADAIREIKDEHREADLLHHAQVHVYGAGEWPTTGAELRTLLIEAGAYIEATEIKGSKKDRKPGDPDIQGPDARVLLDIVKTGGAFARVKVEFDKSKNQELIDEDNIVVLIDSHQQKHQTDQITEFPPYEGGKGSKFAAGKGLAWHQQNTAVTVKETVQNAIDSELVSPTKDYVLKKKPKDGIIYDLLVRYDEPTGKYVGSYHCNPVVDEGD